MKKFLHWVWCFLEVVIICYVILITSLVLCRNKYGYTQFGDITLTNVSLFDERNIYRSKKGDLVVIKNSSDIKVGDLIYYYAVFNDDYIIKSNVVKDIKSDDYTALYTIDDSDNMTIASTRVIGKYVTFYHGVGSFLNVVESKIGFLFLVLLPIMIVFIYQIYEFVIVIKYEEVEPAKKAKTKATDDIEVL